MSSTRILGVKCKRCGETYSMHSLNNHDCCNANNTASQSEYWHNEYITLEKKRREALDIINEQHISLHKKLDAVKLILEGKL